MDSKKANLTPELKEIYDRVMNTSAAKTQAPPPPQQSQPQMVNQIPQANAMPSVDSVMPPPSTPPQVVPPQPQMNMAPQMPPMGAPVVGAPTPAEEALSNSPARPLNNGSAYSFNGGKGASQQAASPTEKKKIKISKPILVVLGLVFIAVWGVFWAIIFGFIER